MFNLFDGHSDTFEDVYEKRLRGVSGVLEKNHLNRWQSGNCVGGFYPIWVDPYNDVYQISVEEQARGIINAIQDDLDESHSFAQVVVNSREYETAVATGKHAIFLGAEGLSFLHGDVNAIDKLYDMDFRIFSLTWNEDNEFAAGASSAIGGGLTEKGDKCVKRIHDLGAILDLAHAHRSSFYDAIKLTDGPFVVSHGNIDALCPHPRNLTDEQMRIIAEHDGVMGISAYPPFIAVEQIDQTIEKFCDNIDYAVHLMGIDHVGLGFDFVDYLDDYGTDPSISGFLQGLEGIHAGQNIADCLAARNYKASEIDKIFQGNFLRVIKAVLG